VVIRLPINPSAVTRGSPPAGNKISTAERRRRYHVMRSTSFKARAVRGWRWSLLGAHTSHARRS